MPNDLKNKAMLDSPIKELILSKKSMPKDDFDKYNSHITAKEIDIELKLKARPKSVLGKLGNIIGKDDGASLLLYNGIKFDDARAEVQFGSKKRTVGIIGYNTNAGVIDVTNDVKLSPNGHPTFGSLQKEVDEILQDCYSILV